MMVYNNTRIRKSDKAKQPTGMEDKTFSKIRF